MATIQTQTPKAKAASKATKTESITLTINGALARKIGEYARTSGFTPAEAALQFTSLGEGITSPTESKRAIPRIVTAPTTTPVELDADLVAKIRASLRAVRTRETLEGLITELLEGMLMPKHGMFEEMIEPKNEHRREEILAKLAEIRLGKGKGGEA